MSLSQVQESLQALDKAKVALLEARLELALWQVTRCMPCDEPPPPPPDGRP